MERFLSSVTYRSPILCLWVARLCNHRRFYAYVGRSGPMNQAARILVVDDESAVRQTLELILRRQGYQVWTAADSTTAQEMLRTIVFDLLLLDLKLPGVVSGLDLAYGAQDYQCEAAILILTGSDEFTNIIGDSSLPYCEIMHKTASPQNVIDQVATMLAQKQKRSAPLS